MDVQKKKQPFVPDPNQMALWPDISGNTINGLGEKEARRPSPVYWHDRDTIPHGPLQDYFAEKYVTTSELAVARERRQLSTDLARGCGGAARRNTDGRNW